METFATVFSVVWGTVFIILLLAIIKQSVLPNPFKSYLQIKYSKCLKNAPGPTPWYGYLLNKYKYDNQSIILWEEVKDKEYGSGKIQLIKDNQICFVVNFRNYILPFNKSKLLIWHQQPVDSGPTQPINLYIFDINLMTPIENPTAIYKEISSPRKFFFFKSGLIFQTAIPTTNISYPIIVKLPKEISFLKELLILCNSSAIEQGILPWEKSDRCLAIINLLDNSCRFYPQDWFNNGGYDYGYQWITRIARDHISGNIVGYGARINYFVLDDSLRNKVKKPNLFPFS